MGREKLIDITLCETEADDRRRKALASWDARPYFIACEESGVKPENLDLYVIGALEQERLNRIERRKARLENPMRYDDLLDYHNSNKVNIEQPVSDDIIKMRRGLINIMEYKKLKVGKGERVLTIDAKPSGILEVYRNCIIIAKSMKQA